MFISPVLAGGKTRFFSKVNSFLIVPTLGTVTYFEVIASTVSLPHFGSAGYPNDYGLLPEEILPVLVYLLPNSPNSVYSLLINSPSFFIAIK